jgi:orotidine-5'-phosphate decarboxylase
LKRVIVALDVSTQGQALELVKLLSSDVAMFKIGSQLFTSTGPDLVRQIVSSGHQVFLDLKFHDIPNTVAAACVEAARLGVSIVNVHATGGQEMMRTTMERIRDVCKRDGLRLPAVIAVTVLTSSDSSTLKETGIDCSPKEHVERLTRLSEESGLDGVVASPHELETIRSLVHREDFITVVPGIRPQGTSVDDQKRVMTPAEAILKGATFLVIGRPITQAADPLLVLQDINREIESIKRG